MQIYFHRGLPKWPERGGKAQICAGYWIPQNTGTASINIKSCSVFVASAFGHFTDFTYEIQVLKTVV